MTEKRSRGIHLLIALVALLPFVPALLRGHILAFRDHADYFYPLRAFTISELQQGRLPLWNPFNGVGEPWLANPQTNVFYPPALLYFVLPFSAAYVLYLAGHLALFGWGAYRLFRRHASEGAALLSAVGLMLAGPTLSLIDTQNNLATLAWVPWLVCAVMEPRPRGKRITLIALLLALMFLAAEPMLLLVSIIVLLCIALASNGRRAAVDMLAAGIIALLLSLPQLLPFVGLLRNSDRMGGLDSELALRNSQSLDGWAALLVPPVGVDGGTTFARLSQQFLPSLFVAPLVVAAILAGLLTLRTSRMVRAAAFIGASLAILAAGSSNPLSRWLYLTLHLDVSRYPARLLPLALLSLGFIASIGFDALRDASLRRRAIPLAALTLMALAASRYAAPEALLPMLLGVTLSALLILAFRAERRSLAVLAVAVVIVPSLLAGAPFFATIDRHALLASWQQKVSREHRIARLLDQRGSAFDLSTRRRWMTGYLNLIEGISDTSTPAPLIDRDAARLTSAALSGEDPALINRLGIRTVISRDDLTRRGLRRIGGSGEARLFANPASRGLAWLEHGGPTTVSMNSRTITIDFVGRTADRLVVTQRALSAWRVFVDGRAVSWERSSDGLFAVAVPEGRHRVTLHYEQRGMVASLLLSLLTLCSLVVLWRRSAPEA